MPAVSQMQRERKRGWKHTSEYVKRLSESRMGDKNPNWNGGTTFEQKADYCRAWRKKNEDHVRDREYQKRFGITLEDYDRMLEAQKGLCAICNKACKRGRLGVDHCHSTGKVRGLLCRQCNIFLGIIGDNPDWLTKASLYLCHSDQTSAITSKSFITDHVTPPT